MELCFVLHSTLSGQRWGSSFYGCSLSEAAHHHQNVTSSAEPRSFDLSFRSLAPVEHVTSPLAATGASLSPAVSPALARLGYTAEGLDRDNPFNAWMSEDS